MRIVSFASNEHLVRKMVLELSNAEEITHEYMSDLFILKNRGHILEKYSGMTILIMRNELENLKKPTHHQALLLKQIKEKLLEVKNYG